METTAPMPLDALSRSPDGLDEFRVSAPSEVEAYLKKLCEGSVPVNLAGPDGSAYSTTVWAVDTARGMVSFSADGDDPALRRLLEGDEVAAVGYLDNIKLQFDVSGLVVVRSGRQSALNAPIPRELFRFQRRDTYRVRPLPRSGPLARVRHPQDEDLTLDLRVLDISVGGCALLLPHGMQGFDRGTVIDGVSIDLDGHNFIRTGLLVHHVSESTELKGARLGCEMVDLGHESLRLLQRFVDQAQQRRRSLLG